MGKYTAEEMNRVYKMLAEAYLFDKYEIDKLDQKFAEYIPHFIPKQRETDQQESLKLRYFYLLNNAHTERLNAEELKVLESIIDEKESLHDINIFIEGTYKKVLAGSLTSGVKVEYFRDVHNRGTFPGNAIIFIFIDTPEYDENGNRDIEREEKKNRVFNNVKAQFEALVNKEDDSKVYLIRH